MARMDHQNILCRRNDALNEDGSFAMFIGDVICAIDNDVIVFRKDDVINCLICLNVILRLSLTTTEGTFLLFRVGVFVGDRLLLFLLLIIFYPLLSPRLIALHWF